MAKKEVLTNFIPINRALFEHPLWVEKRSFSRFEAWIYLIKEARFEDTKVFDGNRIVEVKRGQIYVSVRFFSKAIGWSTKKTLNLLKLLESEKMLKKETVEETGQTLITICNYDEYNTPSKKKETAKETQGKQQGNAKETKSNNVNNKNISSNEDIQKDPQFEKFEKWVNEKCVSVSKMEKPLTEPEFVRLLKIYTPLEIKTGIEAMENSIYKGMTIDQRYKSVNLTFRKWNKKD